MNSIETKINNNNAVIYARYSSENQTEQSIEGQVRVITEYAQRNNIPVLVLRTISDTNKDSTDKYTKNKLSLTQESANYIFLMLND